MATHILSTGRVVATGCRASTPAQLAAARYVGHALKASIPPSCVYNAAAVNDWTMGGNGPATPDDLSYTGEPMGDCVVCDFANGKKVLSTSTGAPEVEINAKECVRFYLQLTGGADNGLNIIDAERAFQTTPIYDISGKAHFGGPCGTIDFTNETELRNAIDQHKKVTLGVAAAQLLQVVGNSSGWALTGARHDPEVDHDVFTHGYGTPAALNAKLAAAGKLFRCPATLDPSKVYYVVYTWHTEGFVDYQSLLAIVGEAHAPQSDPDTGNTPPVDPPPPPPPPPPPSTGLDRAFAKATILTEFTFLQRDCNHQVETGRYVETMITKRGNELIAKLGL